MQISMPSQYYITRIDIYNTNLNQFSGLLIQVLDFKGNPEAGEFLYILLLCLDFTSGTVIFNSATLNPEGEYLPYLQVDLPGPRRGNLIRIRTTSGGAFALAEVFKGKT